MLSVNLENLVEAGMGFRSGSRAYACLLGVRPDSLPLPYAALLLQQPPSSILHYALPWDPVKDPVVEPTWEQTRPVSRAQGSRGPIWAPDSSQGLSCLLQPNFPADIHVQGRKTMLPSQNSDDALPGLIWASSSEWESVGSALVQGGKWHFLRSNERLLQLTLVWMYNTVIVVKVIKNSIIKNFSVQEYTSKGD